MFSIFSAGSIKNQMEARSAYTGVSVEQEAVDSLEVLTDCATSWRHCCQIPYGLLGQSSRKN